MRAVRLCHPGWDALQQITFSTAGQASPWQDWRTEIFLPVLRPQIEAAHLAAATADWRALTACDRAIDDALPARSAAASRRAGASLMAAYDPPAAERLWTRYRGLVASGSSPGHLAVAMAVRAAAFHFPPSALISAYVFLEARGGLSGRGMMAWVEMLEECLPADGAAGSPQIKVA
ncbi:MAG: urease accessory UreF family protein [Terrimicrobiaceae bacterium]